MRGLGRKKPKKVYRRTTKTYRIFIEATLFFTESEHSGPAPVSGIWINHIFRVLRWDLPCTTNFWYMPPVIPKQACRSRGCRGCPQILRVHLNSIQPGATYYAHHIILAPPPWIFRPSYGPARIQRPSTWNETASTAPVRGCRARRLCHAAVCTVPQ